MKRLGVWLIRAALLWISAIIIISPKRAYSDATVKGFSLEGGSVQAYADAGADYEFVYVALPNPRGIFFTKNFGDTWQLATGGDYREGPASHLAGTKRAIYALVGGELIVSVPGGIQLEDPKLGTHGWYKPKIELDYSEFLTTVTADDSGESDHLFLGTSKSRVLHLLLAQDGIIVLGKTTVPANPYTYQPVSSIAVTRALDEPGKVYNLFVETGVLGRKPLEVRSLTLDPGLWSADCAVERGEFSAWVDRTEEALTSLSPNFTDLSPIYRGGIYPLVQGGFLLPFVGMDGKTVIFSEHNGAWRRVRLGISLAFAPYELLSISISEKGILTGPYYSLTGSSPVFQEVHVTGPGEINGKAGLISRQKEISNGEKGMFGSISGPIVTKSLGIEDAALRTTGLTGHAVSSVDVSPKNPDLMLVGYSGGAALCSNLSGGVENLNCGVYPLTISDGENSYNGPVYAVRFDPYSDGRFAYVTGDALWQAELSGNKILGWKEIRGADEDGGGGIKDNKISSIVITEDSIVTGEYGYSGGVGKQPTGAVEIYSRRSGKHLLRLLRANPVSALVAVSDKIMFAGLGGYEGLGILEEYRKRGLWRSEDGGNSWNEVMEPLLSQAAIPNLSYDKENDRLCAAANKTGVLDVGGYGKADNNIGGDDSKGKAIGTEDPVGKVVCLEGASKPDFKITSSVRGLPVHAPVTALTVGPGAGPGGNVIYATIESVVYLSGDGGRSWTPLHTGQNSEHTFNLYVPNSASADTPLVLRAGNDGISQVSGFPQLVAWGASERITSRRGEIRLRFSAPLEEGKNWDRIRVASAKREHRILVQKGTP